MNNEQYKNGYAAYNETNVLSNEQLKQQSSTWRAGYRAAQSESLKRSNPTMPTVLYDVPKRPTTFSPSWNDIMAATRRPRFNKLHDIPQLSPMLFSIIKAVENRSHEVERYHDVLQLVDDAFNLILQYGYDEGVLTETDCSQYNFSPKK